MSFLPPGISFRAVEPSDDPFLLRLFVSVRGEELSMLPFEPHVINQVIEQQFNAKQTHYLKHFGHADWRIILLEGEPVGYVVIEDAETLHFVDLALLSEFRGQGIGGAIFREEMEKGRPITFTTEFNNPARRLYERLGFVITGEDGIYLQMRWDPPAES